MSAVRITLRAPREEVTHWLSMGGASVLFHIAVFAAVLWVPQFFQRRTPFPDVYTVDLVALPPGAPGPPGGSPRASAPVPAPAPAPAPVRQEPTVKIPEKPEAKVPKVKPPKKTEPAKPKPEKKQTEATSPPAPETEGGAEKGTGTAAEGAAGAGAPGGIPGGSGGGGGSGFLDDATFAYGWYLSNMTSILGRNWARPIRPDLDRTLRAVVHFRVLKDGTLADIELEQASGDAALDRSALRAVQDSNPLPPLPYQYGKDSLGVHFFFDLKPE